MFGIMREILQVQNQKILLNSLYPPITILTCYTIGNVLNQKLMLLNRPFVVRGVLYTILGFFGYGLYCLMTDMTQVQYEAETDKALAKLGIGMLITYIIFIIYLKYRHFCRSGRCRSSILRQNAQKEYCNS